MGLWMDHIMMSIPSFQSDCTWLNIVYNFQSLVMWLQLFRLVFTYNLSKIIFRQIIIDIMISFFNVFHLIQALIFSCPVQISCATKITIVGPEVKQISAIPMEKNKVPFIHSLHMFFFEQLVNVLKIHSGGQKKKSHNVGRNSGSLIAVIFRPLIRTL